MPYDGFRRGGAPIALAPEIALPEPGPGIFLDYSKNDEWAVGMIAHDLLSKGGMPFLDMEHPATYSDAGYQAGRILESCRPLVSGLLKVALVDRLDAVDAVRQAWALLTHLEANAAAMDSLVTVVAADIGACSPPSDLSA